jgi:hypothetical protein
MLMLSTGLNLVCECADICRQQVMIAGRKSFGAWAMTEILAKANLLPGAESISSLKMHDDPVLLAQLQNSSLVWDIMSRYSHLCSAAVCLSTLCLQQTLCAGDMCVYIYI